MRRLILTFSFAFLALNLGNVADAATKTWTGGPGYKTFVIGDEAKPTPDPVKGGFLLSGGGDWALDAFRWFTAHSGHGHIVVLRASGTTESQDEFYNHVKGVTSVRTFLFTDRKAAYDAKLLAAIKSADGIFLAGGDQSNYVRMWKGTPLNAALDAHVAAGKPLGGTSAGLAVQGSWLYGAMDGGSITSKEAMSDPLGAANTIEGDFLHSALLADIVTDSHFEVRDRLGRLIAFVVKAEQLRAAPNKRYARPLVGLGIDEAAAMTVESDGTARVHSNTDGHAWLVQGGEVHDLAPGKPLNIANVHVTGIGKTSTFNVRTLEVGLPAFTRIYDVKDGVLSKRVHWSLAIHGGAGIIDRADLTPEKDAAYRGGLSQALKAGQDVLEKGGTALDATQAAVMVLEDNPLFNAGKGAAIAADGNVYLDAAVMDGATQKAGAVAALTRTKNPILAARAVMDKTRHVFLAGEGADAFAKAQGLAQVDPIYFHTPEREQMLVDWKKDHQAMINPTHMYGTVGAVAVDSDGNLAAATSTGGLTGKQWGRIGDSPLIGAGTYARNGDCAVSATGTGEFFIRDSAGRQVCDRVRWNHQGIDAAANDTILSIGSIGGDGGLIAMDASGKASFAINDLGMYRGAVSSDSPVIQTAIYVDETLK
ncbi:isoaspartyl peptidase/L-asparaginase [Asticcacaulis sp. 201]|uniref:isoaspartyl peptidase/L-asparaginase n=1 Tax=Asticcacaulis sp. 201 TaxID=3028787 RepID=UPI002915D916|nr:isoaspartyl peptidase/L-asparaginase [Asticcacaulis sp. 201]MDV6330261.1 isoaspartyl peptidase/L-asparaginase [Asticcacaulis sp. 201]